MRVHQVAAALLVGCSISVVQATPNPGGVAGPATSARALPGEQINASAASAQAAGDTVRVKAKPHQGITKINGKVPPGIVSPAKITLLLREPLDGGQVLYQYMAVRPPGTRAPIHEHSHGGSTCMIKGESTLHVEGIPGARTYREGECFYMPSGPAMANFNSGKIPFMAIDTFILRQGEKPLKVLETGMAHAYEDQP